MSYYGHGQNGHQNQQQLARQAGSGPSSGVLPNQLLGQFQFAPAGNTNTITFPDPTPTNHIQILHQQQQQPAFQNINFLTEQLNPGVGQIISHAAAQNQSQTISLQNLMNPLTMTNLTSVGFAPSLQVTQTSTQATSSQGQQQKQRVFTGTVTKTHDTFGFIDEEVFFQMGAVKGPILPKAGDRVLVEADFNSAMPFKWNATRVQIVNLGGGISNMSSSLNPGGKSQSPQPSPHLQHMHQTFQLQNQPMEKRSQGLVAPPPPILSNVNSSRQTSQSNMIASAAVSNYSQVSLISNPHSIYSPQSQTGVMVSSEINRGMQIPSFQQPPRNPNRGREQMTIPPPPCEPHLTHSNQYQGAGMPQMYQQPVSHPTLAEAKREESEELASKKKRGRSRSRESSRGREEERERNRARERERDREKERRERDLERRERDQERRDRDREKERRDRDRESRKKVEESNRESERDREKGKGVDDGRRSTSTKDKEKEKGRIRSPSISSSRSRKRSRSREKDKNIDLIVCRGSDSEKSPRNKSKSPSRKNRTTARKSNEIPKYSLDMVEMNVLELRKRYPNLFVSIPSDFFMAKAVWKDSIPAYKPLDLTQSTPTHIFRNYDNEIDIGMYEEDPENSEILKLKKHENGGFADPPDASHIFSAKVVLMTLPGESVYKKACELAEETKESRENLRHLNLLINFTVGTASKTAKNETMLIGGAWSQILDGENPHSNPQVLINTAIRTCKAQTGVDLSPCKTWYRFMELHYQRCNGNLETVVVFLVDTARCLPSDHEWKDTLQTYRASFHGLEKVSPKAVNKSQGNITSQDEEGTSSSTSQTVPGVGKDNRLSETVLPALEETMEDEQTSKMDVDDPLPTMEAGVKMERVKIESKPDEANTTVESENTSIVGSSGVAMESHPTDSCVKGPTPVSPLEPNKMNVAKLKEELTLRGLNTKGLKPQLMARLSQALKEEEELQNSSNTSLMTEDEGDIDEKSGTMEQELPKLADLSQSTESQSQSESESGQGISQDVQMKDEASQETVSLTELTTKNEGKIESRSEKSQPNDLNVETNFVVLENTSNNKEVDKGKKDEYKPRVKPGILVPIITEEMDDKTRKIWERRYSLPKKSHIIVHPSKQANGGEFDCVAVTLAALRDHRLREVKESSFEVSLFAEFFHEMLQRDFAFRIYCELVVIGMNSTALESPTDEKPDESNTPTSKKRKLSSASSSGGLQKTPDNIKLKTVDPRLLLSFTYFDTTRCGYLTQTELEELCHALGLGLPSSQLRKTIRKIIPKGNFVYRSLTDKPEADAMALGDIKANPLTPETLKLLSQGNKNLFPVFAYSNVDGLLSEDRCDAKMDASLNVMKMSLNEAKNQVTELKKTNDSLKDELQRTKEALKKQQLNGKTNQEDLHVFRRSSERFYERIKDLIKPEAKEKEIKLPSKETDVAEAE